MDPSYAIEDLPMRPTPWWSGWFKFGGGFGWRWNRLPIWVSNVHYLARLRVRKKVLRYFFLDECLRCGAVVELTRHGPHFCYGVERRRLWQEEKDEQTARDGRWRVMQALHRGEEPSAQDRLLRLLAKARETQAQNERLMAQIVEAQAARDAVWEKVGAEVVKARQLLDAIEAKDATFDPDKAGGPSLFGKRSAPPEAKPHG